MPKKSTLCIFSAQQKRYQVKMGLMMFSIKYFKCKNFIWGSNNINYLINRSKEKTQMIISKGAKTRQVNKTQNPFFDKIS